MSGSHTPYLIKEYAPFQNTQESWKEQKYGHRSWMGPVTKIDHADSDQQKFTQLTD
jgi:hypothetical protein